MRKSGIWVPIVSALMGVASSFSYFRWSYYGFLSGLYISKSYSHQVNIFGMLLLGLFIGFLLSVSN